MLYQTTGRCEFADISEDEIVREALTICERYRVFLAEHGTEELEYRVRTAIEENIELLRTDVWWTALRVIRRYIDAEMCPLITCLDEECRWFVDDETRTYVHDAVRAWWSRERTVLVWDAARQRFVVVDPYAIYDDDELRVADMAGLLEEWKDRPRLDLDWDRIFAGTIRMPHDCR
jgi:hypothetical protein